MRMESVCAMDLCQYYARTLLAGVGLGYGVEAGAFRWRFWRVDSLGAAGGYIENLGYIYMERVIGSQIHDCCINYDE